MNKSNNSSPNWEITSSSNFSRLERDRLLSELCMELIRQAQELNILPRDDDETED